MTFLYHALIFYPLYNAFVLLMDALPFLDAGMIIIVFTIIIRLILYPLAKKSVQTQAVMREINPEIEKIKEKYKDNKEKLSLETLAIYKKYKLNPFASILLLLIQFPILIALYRIFLFAGFTHIDAAILYSFVPVPSHSVSTIFLGMIDVAQKSYIFAFLAAVSQYFQAELMIQVPPKKAGKQSMSDSFARNMSVQMKYVMPVIIFFIAYSTTGVVAIYLTVSNIFMIGQELFVRKQLKKNPKTLLIEKFLPAQAGEAPKA